METKEEGLKKCVVQGNVIKLPPVQLNRELYEKVSVALEGIGGKWHGGKIQGFMFMSDPTELLNQVIGGKKINLRKDYQYYPTPDNLADQLVEMAEITDDHSILEPSAGQGAIVNAINRKLPNKKVWVCEIMPGNKTILSGNKNTLFVCNDFLTMDANKFSFDRIIANPPFSKNKDCVHIMKMYPLLIPGGRLVSFASKHWISTMKNAESAFREWTVKVDAKIIPVPAGSFKKNGTSFATCIIVIDKPY